MIAFNISVDKTLILEINYIKLSFMKHSFEKVSI